MPTPTFVRGTGGKVTAGSTDYAVLDWNLTKTSRLVEVTNSGSNGYAEYFPSVTEGSGTFNAIWDSSNIPDNGTTLNSSNAQDSGADTAGTIEVGKKVTLKLYVGDSGKFYSMDARIESVSVTNTVADVVKFACTFKSTGQITDPT